MENDIEKIRHLLDQNQYMTIATASSSSEPWISILSFAYDESFTLYWCSQDTSLHSRNIDENPFIAISIYPSTKKDNNTLPVIYIRAIAQIVPKAQLDRVITLYDKRMEILLPKVEVSPDDAFSHFPMKMYMAIPEKMYTLKESSLYVNEWIDCRIPLRFQVGKKAYFRSVTP